MTLTKLAVRGAIWQVVGGGWITIVRLGASIFLARALTPADYGVFGIAILMRELIESLGSVGGLSVGLIAHKDAGDEDCCTCFWSMAALRILLFVLAFCCAPIWGWFFHDPLVVDVVRVISLTILFSILGGVSQTLLSKELRFKSLNITRGIIVLLESSLAVFLALNTDLGYWVLVIGTLFNVFFTQLATFFLACWRPKFIFSIESFRYLYRYGINGLGFSITNYLKQNLDYLLVGRLLGSASLGLYEFAYRIPHLVQERISKPVGAVIFPALSKVQDDDEKLAQGYTQTIKYISLVSFPMLFGLAAVADLAVPVLWGKQWLPVITPLRLLCLSAVFKIITQYVYIIFNLKNKPDMPLKFSTFGLVWTSACAIILANLYGINGIAVAMILSTFEGFVALFYISINYKVKISNTFNEIVPSFVSGMISGFLSYLFLKYIGSFLKIELLSLLITVIFGIILYALSLKIFFNKYFGDLLKFFH